MKKFLCVLLTFLIILPTAAQAVFAAADEEVTVIIRMNGSAVSENKNLKGSSAKVKRNYAKTVEKNQEKILEKAEEAIGDFPINYRYTDVYNGASITVRKSEVKQLKKVPGITGVYKRATYKLLTEKASDENVNDIDFALTGVYGAHEAGYKGEGELIAIIDGGFMPEHDAFSPLGSGLDKKLSLADVTKTVTSGVLSSKAIDPKAYLNTKVPYYCDYALIASGGKELLSAEPDHGTHVAGIAAGNGGKMLGVAPDAQLALLAVSFEDDETYTDTLVAAIDDAVKLGADVISMSIGSDNGTAQFDEHLPVTDCVLNARNAGVFVSCAAGNEASSADSTDFPYYSAGIVPGVCPGATAVAAFGSEKFASEGKSSFSVGDHEIEVVSGAVDFVRYGSYKIGPAVTIGSGSISFRRALSKGDYSGKAVPVTLKKGLVSDYRIKRQLKKLEDMGPAAILISESDYKRMTDIVLYELGSPVVISDSDAALLRSSEGKFLSVSPRGEYTGEMAVFSSWSYDINMKNCVRIAAPGVDIFSSVTGNEYDRYSGTSMATPFISGCAAVVDGFVKEKYPSLEGESKTKFVENLLMNAASPVLADGLKASPRLQGAGLVDLASALDGKVMITDALRGGNAYIELGTGVGESFSFDVKLKNLSAEEQTVALSADFTTDFCEKDEENYGDDKYHYLQDKVDALDAEVTFVENDLSLRPGEEKIASVSVTLDASQLEELREKFPKGFYIDGFVTASAGCGETSIPLTGFSASFADSESISYLNFSIDPGYDDTIGFELYAFNEQPLVTSKLTVTDPDGEVVWSKDCGQKDKSNGWTVVFYEATDEDMEIEAKDGWYELTLTVLSAADGAEEEVFTERAYYSPGPVNVLSYHFTESEDYVTMTVVTEKPNLYSAEVTKMGFLADGYSEYTEFERVGETDEGWVWEGKFVFVDYSDAANDKLFIAFRSVAGYVTRIEAKVNFFVKLLYKIRSAIENLIYDSVI